jgi:hypothetical protein
VNAFDVFKDFRAPAKNSVGVGLGTELWVVSQPPKSHVVQDWNGGRLPPKPRYVTNVRPPPDRPGCKCVIDAAVFELLARGPEDFAEQIEMVTIEELQQYKNMEEDDVSRK